MGSEGVGGLIDVLMLQHAVEVLMLQAGYGLCCCLRSGENLHIAACSADASVLVIQCKAWHTAFLSAGCGAVLCSTFYVGHVCRLAAVAEITSPACSCCFGCRTVLQSAAAAQRWFMVDCAARVCCQWRGKGG
jgi:hypothetical protein